MSTANLKVIFIGSGKGGVGKSTVSVNLAIALANANYRVGLLDADLYGPSIPAMMGLRNLSPRLLRQANGEEKVLPFFKFGVQVLSIGFFLEEARSLIWRGPMLHGALEKMLRDTSWGEDLDFLIIDLPPGTGDIPISLSKLLPVSGALVVTTPQEVAILDAIKAMSSFQQLQIPLLGIIENMAGFTVPGTNTTFAIFGKSQGKELAARFQTNFLGSIPIFEEICIGGDEGFPSSCRQGQAYSYFCEIQKRFSEIIAY